MPEVLGLVPSIVKMKMKPKQILEKVHVKKCLPSLNLYYKAAASVIPITYNGLAGLENCKKKPDSTPTQLHILDKASEV